MTSRDYNIDFTNAEEAAKTTLQMFKDQLISYRPTTPNPELLEWEIRLYDFMLEDPVPRFEAYRRARYGKEGGMRSKHETVGALGWVIP